METLRAMVDDVEQSVIAMKEKGARAGPRHLRHNHGTGSVDTTPPEQSEGRYETEGLQRFGPFRFFLLLLKQSI